MFLLLARFHGITLTFIVLELIMLGAQSVLLLQKPEEYHRRWHFILLILLILHNLTTAIFPDSSIGLIPLHVQHMIPLCIGYLMVTYLPLYFRGAFALRIIFPYAFYGMALIFLLGYASFSLANALLSRELAATLHGYYFWFVIGYCIYLLFSVLDDLRQEYLQSPRKGMNQERVVALLTLLPWCALPLVLYLPLSQLTDVLFTNSCYLVATAILLYRSAMQAREEQRLLLRLSDRGIDQARFDANCLQHGLSQAEVKVARYLLDGKTNAAIADALYVSRNTVKTHIRNIYKKTGVNDHTALAAVLAMERPD